MRSYKIALLSLCTLFCITFFGQDKPDIALQSFLDKLSTTIRSHDKQRAWLVTDKSVFRAGETIWFKAFLLNSLSQKTFTKSKFLFVDLVNEKDSVVNTLILDAANKQLNSRFVLANTIPAGFYWVRAYTRQMAEEGGDGICAQPIYIFGNTGNANIVGKRRSYDNPDSLPQVTFYPEGNNIITGVTSTVALQVNHKNGDAVVTDGYIKDNRDSVVARFTTNKNGLGKFAFESSGYRKYKAVINWNGKEASYPLPSFNFYGGQLSITKLTDSYKLRVLLGDSIYRKDAVTYIVGVAKDSLIFASVGKGQYEIAIDKGKLTAGINTFYLFDKDFKVISERSVYQHDNNLQVKLTTDKTVYAPREKVPINISITDASQHSVPSLITISVVDTLLSVADAHSALPGAACDAAAIDNVFFASNENISDDNADLLMLVKNNTYASLTGATHGVAGAPDADSLLYIKGQVLDDKKKPLAGKLATLVSKTKEIVSYTDITDDHGRFRFPIDAYLDSTQFMMEIKTPDGKPVDNVILHDPIVYPKLKTPACLKQYLPIQTLMARKYFKTYPSDELVEGDGKTLQPVTVTSTSKANYDESKRISNNSVILASDRINERNKISDVVMLVGGLQILNGYLVMLGPSNLLTGIGPLSEPMLVVNGAPATVIDRILPTLDSYNPRDIDFIEILKGPEAAMFGVRGGNGVISVNTKSSQKDAGGSGIKVFYPKGISEAAMFPNAANEKKGKKAITIADSRSTLYWSGNYLTDETHNPSLTFYTNDISSAYKITITGITIHGDVVYKSVVVQNK